MAIEIVDFPIKNCDFPVRYVKLPEGKFWPTYIDIHCQIQCAGQRESAKMIQILVGTMSVEQN